MFAKPSACQQLGIKHALSDASAGYIAGCWLLFLPIEILATLFIVYNLIAFGCQPIFSLLPERFEKNAIRFSLLLTTVALMIPAENYWLTLLCMASASALFHVSAGARSLRTAHQNTLQISWFVAPGVLGLLTGIAAGISEFTGAFWILMIGLFLSILISDTGHLTKPPTSQNFELHSFRFWLATTLLLLISIRSLVWSFYQGYLPLEPPILLTLGVAAFLGKLAGGWLDTHYTLNQWLLPVLMTATYLLLLTEQTGSLVTLAFGLACLQSVTPVMLKALNQYLQKPALSASLGLGLAITLGGGILSILTAAHNTSADSIFIIPAALLMTCLLVIPLLTVKIMSSPGTTK